MRVILADDAAVIRQGLARLLEERGVEVVGQAASADRLLALVAADPPDVAVIDIRMPPSYTDEGLHAARAIRRQFPAVATMVLSQHTDSAYALELISGARPGAVGYLLKDRIVDVDGFIRALERVAAGGIVVEPELVAGLLDRPARTETRPDALGGLDATGARGARLGGGGQDGQGDCRGALGDPQDGRDPRAVDPCQAGPAGGRGENRRVHAVLAFLQSNGVHAVPAK